MQKETRELTVEFKIKKDGTAEINILKGFPKKLKKSFTLRTKPGRAEFTKCAEMAIDLIHTEAGRNSVDCPNACHSLPKNTRNNKLSDNAANASVRRG